MFDALQRTAESLLEGLALPRAVVCSRYTWMARVRGLIAGWLGDGVWPDGYDVHGEARAGNGAAPRAASTEATAGVVR